MLLFSLLLTVLLSISALAQRCMPKDVFLLAYQDITNSTFMIMNSIKISNSNSFNNNNIVDDNHQPTHSHYYNNTNIDTMLIIEQAEQILHQIGYRLDDFKVSLDILSENLASEIYQTRIEAETKAEVITEIEAESQYYNTKNTDIDTTFSSFTSKKK